jgi:hypothetical protein
MALAPLSSDGEQRHGEALAEAARHYREVFGWPVRVTDGSLELRCGHDITAIAIPASWACNVTHRLASAEALGPVIGLPGPSRYWVLLAQSNGAVEAQRDALPGVVLFAPNDSVPLPVGEPGDDRVRWVVAPNPARRWLPTLTSVLFAVAAIPTETKRAAARLLMRESASRGLRPWGSDAVPQQQSRLAS